MQPNSILVVVFSSVVTSSINFVGFLINNRLATNKYFLY